MTMASASSPLDRPVFSTTDYCCYKVLIEERGASCVRNGGGGEVKEEMRVY